jgi:hypothetical protein
MWIVELTLICAPAPVEPAPAPEERALTFLAAEVRRWPGENKCFSCHNNSDGARALYAGLAAGRSLPAKTLDETTRWLADPARWEKNGGDGPFNDRKRANLQFAAALASAVATGQIKDREPLLKASAWVAEQQERDGHWETETDGGIGSPATHGGALATALARRTLLRADERKYAHAIARTDAWLRNRPVPSVAVAAGVLFGLGQADDDAAREQRRKCLDVIRRGVARDGGWGPYVTSGSEVFDTAVVVLALAEQKPTDEIRTWLRGGRAYLLSQQRRDGSWSETTRPSGGDSYAQRISTSAWATLALLATTEPDRKPPTPDR